MAENYNLIAAKILKAVGGPRNIKNVSNCMTRLRLSVIDNFAVNIDELKKIEGVLQVITDEGLLQIVLGPGKVVKITAEFNQLISVGTIDLDIAKKEEFENELKNIKGLTTDADWKVNKALIKAKQRRFAWLSKGMRHLANIFSPLIPAIIAAGLFAALAAIVNQFGCNNAFGGGMTEEQQKAAIAACAVAPKAFYYIFKAFDVGFTTYLVIATGYNAAKEFGATPMLGLMLGGICGATQITDLATTIGIGTNILKAGKGGVIGVILACWLLSIVERFLHKKMPNSLDTVFTPFLSILLIGTIYIFGIMIATGFISDGLVKGITFITKNNHVVVRLIAGFIAGALFLPMVMMGMHHGLVAFYSEEVHNFGYCSLYPALAMAGAGQVGAAIALYIKAKRMKNNKLKNNITGSIIPGILGVGEPLIYSVTLPLGSPFITAGIGAGLGGAFVMAFEVGSTAWGPSGLVAIPLMIRCNISNNVLVSYALYTAGLLIAAIGGFLITYFFIKDKKAMPKELDPREIAFKNN